MDNFITQLPKVELHLHIEGTLEADLMFRLAERNGIQILYESPDALREARQFTNLQEFLEHYYQAIAVLRTAKDFYELAMAYFSRCDQEKILHREIFFTPQAHLHRGISMATIMEGLLGAQQDANMCYGSTGGLILSLLRERPEEDGLKTLRLAKPWQHKITGIGLESAESGNPPEKFIQAFKLANEYGWHCVVHAGEEGPPEYIWGALKKLNVKRIDHGVRALEDQLLIDYLVEHQVPLTICPLSNVKLGIFPDMEHHNLKQLLKMGLCVTLNSDDPAYSGGYLTHNMLEVQKALNLSEADWIKLTRNSIKASFAPAERKQALYQRLQRTVANIRGKSNSSTKEPANKS